MLVACLLGAVITVCAITIPVVIVTSYDDVKEDAQAFAGRDVLDEVPLIDG